MKQYTAHITKYYKIEFASELTSNDDLEAFALNKFMLESPEMQEFDVIVEADKPEETKA